GLERRLLDRARRDLDVRDPATLERGFDLRAYALLVLAGEQAAVGHEPRFLRHDVRRLTAADQADRQRRAPEARMLHLADLLAERFEREHRARERDDRVSSRARLGAVARHAVLDQADGRDALVRSYDPEVGPLGRDLPVVSLYT